MFSYVYVYCMVENFPNQYTVYTIHGINIGINIFKAVVK